MNMPTEKQSKKCGMKCEVYSRVCGYHRPVANWNRGKQEEFKQRVPFSLTPPASSRSAATSPL